LSAAVALVALAPSSFADEPLPPTVPELHCPPAAHQPAPPVPHVNGLTTENTEIPGAADVGDMARPVELYPPVLDLDNLAAFKLTGEDGKPRARRFAVWGDSHVAAGPMMGQLVAAIRARGETVATRFLPPTMGRANVRLPALHSYCIGPGWSTELAFKDPGPMATGPALATRVASAGPDSYLWLDLRTAQMQPQMKQVTLVYRASASDAQIGVSVDDGAERIVTLAAGSTRQAIAADAALSTVKIRLASGSLALEGIVLCYIEPPLVSFDVFGLPSSTIRGWGNVDPDAMATALGGERYDGVILEYGTNDGAVEPFDAGAFQNSLIAALSNMRRVFPDADCVLIGPPDRGVLLPKVRGTKRPDFLKFARIHARIADIEAQVGAKFGCVPWDWQAYMGGAGGSYGWAHHNPVLMGADLTHMTLDGYKRTGAALAQSLGWAGSDQSVFPR
jgi:lysophospholipase L1-like esterase